MGEEVLGTGVVRLLADASGLLSALDTIKQKSEKGFGEVAKGIGDMIAKTFANPVVLAGAVTGLATSLAVIGVKVADYADHLDEMSQKTGVAVEDLSGLSLIAKQNSVSLDGMAGGLKFLNRSLAEAASGSQAGIAAFDKLGKGFYQANIAGKSTNDALAALADQFAKMADGPQKVAASMQIFGRAGVDLIPILNGGGEAIRASREEAELYGTVIDEKFSKQSAALADNQDRLGEVFRGLAIVIGREVVPILLHLTDSFLKWYEINAKVIQQNVVRYFQAIRDVFIMLIHPIEAIQSTYALMVAYLVEASIPLAGVIAKIFHPFSSEKQKQFVNDFKQFAVDLSNVAEQKAKEYQSHWEKTDTAIVETHKKAKEKIIIADEEAAKRALELRIMEEEFEKKYQANLAKMRKAKWEDEQFYSSLVAKAHKDHEKDVEEAVAVEESLWSSLADYIRGAADLTAKGRGQGLKDERAQLVAHAAVLKAQHASDADAIVAINAALAERLKVINGQIAGNTLESFQRTFAKVADVVRQAAGVIMQYLNRQQQQQLARLIASQKRETDIVKNSWDAKIAAAKAAGLDTVDLETQRDAEMAELERKHAARKLAADKKAFENQQKQQAVMVMINSIAAGVAVLPDYVDAAIIWAIGIAEAAVIMSQKFQGQAHNGSLGLPNSGSYNMEGNEFVADKESGPVISRFAKSIAQGEVTHSEAGTKNGGKWMIGFEGSPGFAGDRSLIAKIAQGLVVYVRDEGGNIIARSLVGSAGAA